ncbi:hypothetical protein [Streptomyces sp. NPDC003697]
MKLGKALATGVAEERPEITEGPEPPEEAEESQAVAGEEVPAPR